jgi:hypothetical protein
MIFTFSYDISNDICATGDDGDDVGDIVASIFGDTAATDHYDGDDDDCDGGGLWYF